MARLAATKRFAGSAEETQARRYCRSLLEDRGFSVEDQPFEYSKAPALWGPSLTSALAATAVWLGAHLATRHQSPALGLLVDLGGLAAIAVLAIWGAKVGVLGFPAQRSTSTNLVGVRREAGSRPTVWLCAHIDSKSQTIPMLVRVTSTALFAFMSVAVAVSILVILFFPGALSAVEPAATVLSWLAVVTALPIVFCFITNRSNGALDNATGVAAILLALDEIDRSNNIGVIITSAEELGLAGARHFADTETTGEIAINCDTIDDAGFFYCMASGTPSRTLDEAIRRASNGSLQVRPMIPGILADNVAFTAKGWESLTVSRGNLGTLGYVHTSRDTSDRLNGTGIAQASSLIAAIVEELA
ncbi:MAG TPA: M28 family peptidase [Gemmatimonadaceae bacterium]|nr:M28 family peptidase [Gemmatimonadaceae bacterium]